MRSAARVRRREALLISFAVPVLALLLICFQRGIFPFGNESFLRTDLYHQYAPFFSEFQEKLVQGKSLLYSWDVGLGVNFSAIYAYYLASPLNWLTVFCPKPFLIEWITLLIVLKTGLCGLSMTWYLQEHGRHRMKSAALFGIFYALSAYMAAYSWNVMWLDCILLFPFIMRGMERLIHGEDSILYTVALAVSISSNYYISIMICLFLIIYGVALVSLSSLKPSEIGAAAVRFVLCSLIAGGVSAVILLPEIFALQSTASGEFSFPKTFEAYFPILDMLARHLANVKCEIGLKHWPNLYCGTAVLQLSLLYFLNRRIPLRERVVYGILLLFLLAGFSVNVLNYIWHGFHYPNSLPARQSFIYIFLVLTICYRTLDETGGNTGQDMTLSFGMSFGFVLFCQKFAEAEYFHFAVYYAAMFLVAFYAWMLRLWRTRSIRRSRLFALLLFAVFLEGTVNLAVTSVPTTSRTEYTEDNRDIRALRDMAPKEDFFRFEKVKQKSKDDGAWLNFPSVSLFSSTAQKSLSDFMRDVGCEASVNAYSITGSTPLVDSLLCVHYGFYPSTAYNRALKEVGQSGGMVLYENPDVFPLGYVVPSDLEVNWTRTLENPAEVQNGLCRLMKVPDVLEEIPVVSEGQHASFVAEEEGEYYAFSTNAKLDQVKVSLQGSTRTFDNLKRRYFMELGTFYSGDSATFENAEKEGKQKLDLKVYRFRYEALHRLREAMVQYPMQIQHFSDTEIRGSVRSDAPAVLLTSIPYDAGWHVEMDGIRVDTEPYFGAFLSLRIPAGSHEIYFRYVPKGLIPGGGITLFALLFLAFLVVFERRRSAGRKGKRRLKLRRKAKHGIPENMCSELTKQ